MEPVHLNLYSSQATVWTREDSKWDFWQSVETYSGVHPAYYTLSTRDHPRGVKRPRREADHSYPSSEEVKNGGAISHFPIRL
jgi:hypothetical protein